MANQPAPSSPAPPAAPAAPPSPLAAVESAIAAGHAGSEAIAAAAKIGREGGAPWAAAAEMLAFALNTGLGGHPRTKEDVAEWPAAGLADLIVEATASGVVDGPTARRWALRRFPAPRRSAGDY